jgi:flagellar basal-body rod protein FlgC
MNASEFDLLETASAGMDAQRAALDLAARNVAASQVDGGGFARLVPRYSVAPAAADASTPDAYEPPDPSDADGVGDGSSGERAPIRYLGATAERGVDVDAITEMVSVLDAQRAYEANASVFDIGKRLAERTIDMGRLQ